VPNDADEVTDLRDKGLESVKKVCAANHLSLPFTLELPFMMPCAGTRGSPGKPNKAKTNNPIINNLKLPLTVQSQQTSN